jgi:hypothetical protein
MSLIVDSEVLCSIYLVEGDGSRQHSASGRPAAKAESSTAKEIQRYPPTTCPSFEAWYAHHQNTANIFSYIHFQMHHLLRSRLQVHHRHRFPVTIPQSVLIYSRRSGPLEMFSVFYGNTIQPDLRLMIPRHVLLSKTCLMVRQALHDLRTKETFFPTPTKMHFFWEIGIGIMEFRNPKTASKAL